MPAGVAAVFFLSELALLDARNLLTPAPSEGYVTAHSLRCLSVPRPVPLATLFQSITRPQSGKRLSAIDQGLDFFSVIYD